MLCHSQRRNCDSGRTLKIYPWRNIHSRPSYFAQWNRNMLFSGGKSVLPQVGLLQISSEGHIASFLKGIVLVGKTAPLRVHTWPFELWIGSNKV